MKRILTLLLVLALSVAALASCDVLSKIPGLGDLINPPCTEHVDADGDYVCDNCEAELERPHEHTWVDATCTSPKKCSECGATEGDPIAHTYGENGSCSCGALDPEYEALLDASAYVRQLYKDEAKYTPKNYNLVGVVPVGDVNFTVVWTVDYENITIVTTPDGSALVTVPELDPDHEYPYTLTATITSAKGYVATRTFERALPMLQPMTFDEFVEAEDAAFVTIQGLVSGVFSKSTGSTINGLYVQDMNGDGGYYVYALEEDVNGKILPGMTVRVSGTKDVYNGTLEVVDAAVTVVDETIKEVTPVDYTDKLSKAEALDSADLVYAQGLLVTIKGVTIGEPGDNGYYYFHLGDKQVYLRISSSNNATTKEALEAIKSAHAANYANIADVTGVISVYSGKFYLVPVSADAFNNFKQPERTDAEKLELELETIKLPDAVVKNTVITLPTTGASYDAVKFDWKSDKDCAVVKDGTLTVTLPEEATTVTLTLTATIGELTETKTYEISVSAKSKFINVVVDTPVDGEEYYFMLTQENLNKDLFFNGKMDGYYFATAESAEEAVKIKVVALADGKYDLMVGEKYLGIIHTEEGYINVKILDEAPAGKFVWNTEYKTFTTDIEGKGTYYLGTYSNYNTISASTIDKAATSFVAHLVLVKPDSDGQVNLTDTLLGLGAYAEGTAEVEDFGFGFTELGSYGNGIQMRIKEDRVASLWNTVGFTYGIAKIELVYNSEKSPYDNKDAFAFYFGNDSEVSACTVKLSTVAGQKVYTITPDKDTYTFFKMELLLSYSFYWDEINIVLTNFEEEACEHEWADATCTEAKKCGKCGETEGEALGHKINAETHLCSACGADDPEYYWPMTIPEALAANKGKLVSITGKVVEIKEAWSSYNNMSVYIEDEAGNKIYVFRTKTQVNLGDTITVSGKVDVYNDEKQIGSGSTAVIETGEPEKEEVKIALTDTALGLGAYAAGNATVDGANFAFTELGSYGNGIQMRIKNGNVATLWNTSAFSGGIIRIELVYNSEKSTYDNTDAFAFYFGNDSEVSGCTVKLSTVAGQKVYTITPDKDTYTFFKMELLLSYTFYWDEINIIVAKSDEEQPSEPETPVNPECTIPEALERADGADVIVTGTVTADDNNNSVTIKDADGNTLYAYKVATAISVGDVVTITGKMGTHNDNRQIAQGATAVIDTKHTCEYNPATCLVKELCKYCGAEKEGSALGDHSFDETGLCACGLRQFAEGVNVADFDSFVVEGTNDNSYTNRTNKDGWTINNGRCDEQSVWGGADQIILNGKTSNVGKLTSCKLTGGIKKLYVDYGYAFSESNGVSFKIVIKNAEGTVVASTDVVNADLAKLESAQFVWTLETPVEGEFVIEIVNNCPTNKDGNADRYTLFNLAWENV